ncbi:MAG: GyrI-like domain-containing protein [Actinobacteria bacterium]|nr:GyrI-like domain-containing protein [Actinomycetota bacterium]
MEKIDYKKKLKELYNPSAKKVTAVNVPKMNFLMVDGQGDPGKAKEFQEAIEALFSVSYNLKFKIKKSKAIDYGVMPLEGLWWSEDMEDFIKGARDKWKWTLMIMQPEFITQELVKEAISEVEKKKNLPALSKMRFESYEEGLSAQIMHIGPFSEEGPNIQRIHKYIEEQGKKLRGEHHEIYLSDFRKVAPEKMKTVLRQPMA